MDEPTHTGQTMPADWLKLIYAKGLALAAKRTLVNALGSPGAVLGADSTTLAEVLAEDARAAAAESSSPVRPKGLPKLTYPNVDADLEALARIGGDLIGFTEPDFPPLLNQINSAPLGVFTLGDRALLATPQLAMVGSRTPTPSGRRTTEQFAAALCATGLTITSGMALGIDNCAHRGSLDSGGKTIAVIGTGIDVVYPRANQTLYDEIAEKGLIVSEYPPGTPPRREFFPQRNRIISGLSLGTLVVEAGIRSGSLITARMAGEQGREVFAVPGSIHVPVSRGCHSLLRQGAKLVETPEDILEEIGQYFTAAHASSVAGSDPLAPQTPPAGDGMGLYNLIDYTPTSIDQLIALSGLTADQVSYILTGLELDGWIAAGTGGYQRLPR